MNLVRLAALFAEELAKTKQNITIITNSVYLADYVADYSNIQIILLGGTLQPKGRSLVGPLTKQAIKAFHVDKIFTGTDGFSMEFGFTGEDLTRTDTVREMTNSADHTYILADSANFVNPELLLIYGFRMFISSLPMPAFPKRKNLFSPKRESGYWLHSNHLFISYY